MWKDFTLSRIDQADWPMAGNESLPMDEVLAEKTLTLRANAQLLKADREAVEMDFGMTDGKVETKVRGILENYLRTRLGLSLKNGERPQVLVELAE